MHDKNQESILVVAGEASGDNLAAPVLSQLKDRMAAEVNFWGAGGDKMAGEGLELLYHIRGLEAIGFEILRKLPFFLGLVKEICQEALRRKTKLALLVDYPGFNLKLAECLKRNGIAVVFYVAPQIWAWRYSRIKKIRERVDLLLLLYEFEKEIFDREKVANVVVGHPLSAWIEETLSQEKDPFIGDKEKGKYICLMPGSRSSEIKRLLPLFLQSAAIIRKDYPQQKFLLPYNNLKMEEYILRECSKYNIQVLKERAIFAIRNSRMVILASGTASLEVAYFRRPMLIAYRIGQISYHSFKRLIRIPYIGLVNILAGKLIVPEFIQSRARASLIAEEALAILEDRDDRRERMLAEMEIVEKQLKAKRSSQEASNAIFNFWQKLKIQTEKDTN